MFDGSPDPTEAEDWLKKIQQIFTYMGLEDHERVAYSANQLKREALCWWEYVVLAKSAGTSSWRTFEENTLEKLNSWARYKNARCPQKLRHPLGKSKGFIS